MLSLKTFPYLHRPTSPFKSLLSPSSPPPLFSPPVPFLSLSSSSSSAADAAKMAPISTVEHVVLFKVRDSTDPSKIDSMVSNLRSLTSLNLASHLTAGPILRLRSSAAAALGFTHLLHSRYASKPDLAAYAVHPAHLTVVKNDVLPICDDIMAADWVADLDGPISPPPGSAVRLTLAKPKEGAAAAEILAAMDGIGVLVPGVEQVSFGENFSPARAKGYDVGFISVFPGVDELDKLESEGGDLVEMQKEKVRPLLESVVVFDYVIPTPSSASLL